MHYALTFGATAASQVDITSLLLRAAPALCELGRMPLGDYGRKTEKAYLESVQKLEADPRYVGKTGLFTAGPDLGPHLAFSAFDQIPLLRAIAELLVEPKTEAEMLELLRLMEPYAVTSPGHDTVSYMEFIFIEGCAGRDTRGAGVWSVQDARTRVREQGRQFNDHLQGRVHDRFPATPRTALEGTV